MVRMSTLKSIAIYGGILSLGGAGYFYTKIQDNLVSGSYYSKSMQILGDNEEAMAKLGPPVKSKYLDLSDKFNKVDGVNCSLKIGVRGSKTKGTLFTWAERSKPGADWEIQKLFLQYQNSESFIKLYEAPVKEGEEVEPESEL
ncbi:cytochrome c oxidase assembly factor 1 homolog [Ptychodera flava]|uniref:cytochrome c oxidase assembly factor 1 homolog n=1 Tax=Ptychodera flava TaxID=63121 RepID=UPI00396A514D